MNEIIKKMDALVLLEFGIPHYRFFIFKYFEKSFRNLYIIHSGERFEKTSDFKNEKGVNIKLGKDISLNIFNILKIRKYDFIISTLNFRKPHTWLPFFLFKKKRWVFWGQGTYRSNNYIFIKLFNFLINNSLGYVVYTESGKKNLINKGIRNDKISIAYNTLAISNFALTNGNKYFLYVGRVQERKGLIKVIRSIKGTKFHFKIIGKGEYKETLINLTEELELSDQISFHDAIYDQNELMRFFSSAIAYVSPDHVGLGVVHSFAYGVPVITNKHGVHAPEFEYCNEGNSYLYNSDLDLQETLTRAKVDLKAHKTKRINAFNFYLNNLSEANVIKAFNEQFEKAFE